MKLPSEPNRTLPHRLEAERAVLGAILIDNELIHRAHAVLSPSHFFRDAHRRIFEHAVHLSDAHTTIDLVTLKDALEKSGCLDEVGGPAYLASLVDGVPASTNIDAYVQIVRDMALHREIIGAANKIVAKSYEAEEPSRHVLRWAEDVLLDLQGGYRGTVERLSEATGQLFKALEFRVAHKGELTGVDTGFPSINQLTMGWQAGDLIIVAARTSIGKSAFAINSAIAAARIGKRIIFFSLEMRRKQIKDRILSSLSGVPLTRLLGGYISDHEYAPIATALDVMHGLVIDLDDTAGLTVRDIRSTCRRLRSDGGLDLVVIDYVQLMPGTLERRGVTRNEELTDISRRLKLMADELHVPIIVLSQVNRGSDGRVDQRPRLSDLRESGSLEQNADLVCFLHRKSHQESGVTNFIIEKARNGPTGTVNLTLDRDITLFVDGGEDPPPQEQTAAAKPKRVAPPWLFRGRKGED